MRYLNFKALKTVSLLEGLVVTSSVKLDGFMLKFCGYKTDNVIPKIDDTFVPLPEYLRLEENDSHFWIIGKVTTPKAEKGKRYEIEFFQEGVGGLQTIIYVNGEMRQGVDWNHRRTILEPDKTYDIAFYCYFDHEGGSYRPTSITIPKLVTICEKTEKLYYDLYVPTDALNNALSKDSDEYNTILHHLEIASNLIDFRYPYSEDYYNSLDKAIKYLDDEFYGKAKGQSEITVDCLGQTHLDVAWLWPLRQTIEKTQRSFSTVLYLMEHYPEYSFMSSTPQLYQYMKDQAPENYEKIKQRVKEGRWEVEGAMWLEADTNLPSGESFIRQLLYGKRFIKEEFGIDSHILWMPDVFGYSATLPQILQKAGVDYFVTGKISWNDTNVMPHHTFYWKGIDGTEIFTHFLTTKDFGFYDIDPAKRTIVKSAGVIDPREIKSCWDEYKDKEYNNLTVHNFGHGDGGGGPTALMLERYRRVSRGIPGIPKARMNSLAGFLEEAKSNFDKSCEKFGRTPKWTGELYLEFHRGTFTSIAKTKKANRKCEFLLGEGEALSVFDMIVNKNTYPAEKLEKLWKIVLLNQFHDIIPGSSITDVNDTAEEYYNEAIKGAKEIISCARTSLLDSISSGEGTVVFNPHSYETSDVVLVDGKYGYVENIPAFGYKKVDKIDYTNNAQVGKNSISNKFYDITFDEKGNIVKCFDKLNNREMFTGVANKLVAYEDRPNENDAWDIACYYKQKPYDIDFVTEIVPFENGAKKGLTIRKKFMDSTIVQNIVVYDNIPKIDFETEIDWHNNHILVKALFPVNVFTDKITAEIQMGNLVRNTHSNTSWDEAHFEDCAHKYIDMSDNSYGISFLNDCKYGYSADENEIGLTLIKSATHPDPVADQGTHKFTYSVYAHSGTLFESDTVCLAYNLNQKMTAVNKKASKGTLPEEYSFITVENKNIILETVKKAEDDNNIIVRFYDAQNTVSNAKIHFGFDVKKAYLCDLNENVLEEIEIKDNAVSVPVKNFEIMTLKLMV